MTTEAMTQAGREHIRLWLEGRTHPPSRARLVEFSEGVIAAEAEAVAAWLDSPDAERRLAAALVTADAAVADGWPTDKAIAKAILAALTERNGE